MGTQHPFRHRDGQHGEQRHLRCDRDLHVGLQQQSCGVDQHECFRDYVFDNSTTKLTFAGNGPTTLTLTVSKAGYTSGTITLTRTRNTRNKNAALTLGLHDAIGNDAADASDNYLRRQRQLHRGCERVRSDRQVAGRLRVRLRRPVARSDSHDAESHEAYCISERQQVPRRLHERVQFGDEHRSHVDCE